MLERGEVRTLCATLACTGCRITEALELAADRDDLSSQVVTFRSLKTCNPRLLQRMLGHASRDTSAIYMDVVGSEARDEMALTW